MSISKDRIEELKEQIAELLKRWPAHSVPPVMMELLDELEEELRREVARSGELDNAAGTTDSSFSVDKAP